MLNSSLVAFAVLVLLTRAIAMVVADPESLAFSSRRGEAKRMIAARGSCVHLSTANALICWLTPLVRACGCGKEFVVASISFTRYRVGPYAFEK